MDEETRVHLASRYGHAANLVMRLAAVDPALAERISPDLPDIAAEAAFAVDHEQAHTVADVLLRRTRLGLLDARRLCEDGAEGPRGWRARWPACSTGTTRGWSASWPTGARWPRPRAWSRDVSAVPRRRRRAARSLSHAPGAAPEEAA